MAVKDYARKVFNAATKQIKVAVKKFLLTKVLPVVLVVVLIVLIVTVVVSAISGGGSGTVGMQGAGGTAWNQFLSYVETKEGGTKVDKNGNKNPNGEYYIVENDSKNNPTVGHGLCLYSTADKMYLHEEAFKKYGYNSRKLADNWINDHNSINLVKVEDADQIWRDHLKSKYDSIVANYSNMNLTQYQYYALTDVSYRRGNTNGFKEAYNEKWTESDNKYGEDVSGEKFSKDSLFSFFEDGWQDKESGVYTRKQEQWLLFKYGYYRPLNEYYTGNAGAEGFIDNSNVYNADGSVNEEYLIELQTELQNTYNLVKLPNRLGAKQSIGGQYNKEACEAVTGEYFGFDHWQGEIPISNGGSYIYQCPWWALSRASSYLGKNCKVSGNGKDVAKNLVNSGFGHSSAEPVPNSVVSYYDDGAGHVAYIEAVDTKNKYYYISHVGSGETWYGIHRISYKNGLTESTCFGKKFNGICVLGE